MKILRIRLLTATMASALLFCATPSFAADDTADLNKSELTKIDNGGSGAMMDHGSQHMHKGDVDGRIHKLHDQLMITPDQEAQWSSVADVMRDNSSMMSESMDKRKNSAHGMTAVEDMQSFQKLTAEHAEGLQKLVDAFTPLYNSMSPAQQKNADMIFGHKVMAKKGA